MKTFVLVFFVLAANIVLAQKITGKVMNEGYPLPGASITIKDTKGWGTITDFEGEFSLNLPKNASVLVFKFKGFTTVEQPIVKGQTYYEINMELRRKSRKRKRF